MAPGYIIIWRPPASCGRTHTEFNHVHRTRWYSDIFDRMHLQVHLLIDGSVEGQYVTWCSDKDETIYHIISEYSKQAQKEYKTRHDWVRKLIYWEQCKKLKFEHTKKWYMYKLKSILKNEKHNIHSDFEIQTESQTGNNALWNYIYTQIPIDSAVSWSVYRQSEGQSSQSRRHPVNQPRERAVAYVGEAEEASSEILKWSI